jgi:hypothetical protein
MKYLLGKYEYPPIIRNPQKQQKLLAGVEKKGAAASQVVEMHEDLDMCGCYPVLFKTSCITINAATRP